MQNTQFTDTPFAPKAILTHSLQQANLETAGTRFIIATVHDGKAHPVTALSVRLRLGGAQ